MAEAMGMHDRQKRRDRVTKKRPQSTRKLAGAQRRATVTLALAATALFLLFMGGTASAALKYTKATEFQTQCEKTVSEITVDDLHHWLYVTCGKGERETGGFGGSRTIRRYNLDGTQAPFSADATEPYLEGNTVLYGHNPEESIGAYEDANSAVDNSSSPNSGHFFYIGKASGGAYTIEQLLPSGVWNGQYVIPLSGNCCGIDISEDGTIVLGVTGGAQRFIKYSPSFHEEGRIIVANTGLANVLCLKTDTTGAIWSSDPPFGGDGGCSSPSAFNQNLAKVEDGQWLTGAGNIYTETEAEQAGFPPNPTYSPFVETTPFIQNGQFGFDVDRTNNDLLVNKGDRIEVFYHGDAEQPVFKDAPDIGVGDLSGSGIVAVDANRNVYTRNGSTKIVKFVPAGTLPDVVTKAPEIDDIGHTSAVLRGKVKLAGGPNVTECKVEYGSAKGSYTKSAPCDQSTPIGADMNVTATIPKAGDPALTTGATYHYRFAATNATGTNYGADRSVRPVAVLKVHTLPATEVGENEATLNGSFDPDGEVTHYYFEYGLDTEYGQTTPEEVSGTTPATFSTEVTGLPSGRTFHYRIAARNALGTTFGPDVAFRTTSPPEVSGLTATELTGTSAVLNARVNPDGFETEYHFEYGESPSYGNSVPASPQLIGSGNAFVHVENEITGLQVGVTYHFRVVAHNQWGDTFSEDTTFDYSPPACPNSHVRQQTRANYLPDCRGYELVTPGDAGAILMLPSDAVLGTDLSSGCAGAGCKSRVTKYFPINTGLAQNPPRFAYFGAFGSYVDQNATNSLMDEYVATRTETGWKQSLPGIKGNEGLLSARTRCSEDLSLCSAHNDGDTIYYYPAVIEAAAGLFSVPEGGKRIGDLPTNVNAIPGARFASNNQYGDELPSSDYGHFAFSSLEHVFAPGGVVTAPGSAYDNDVSAKTVQLISKTPSGANIPADVEGNEKEVIEFPGISADGSHILMQVEGADGPAHLYMRVDDAVTYDVSRGAGVTFIGMTRDGGEVYFAASQQLTLDDTDNSVDVYRWTEQGNTLTRVSQGNGEGNSDECSPSWGSQCSTVPIETERGHPFDFPSYPALDDFIAEESGDVYFYSPESLDPEKPGIRNQRNLYVYHDGAVHLVGTFDPGTFITRMTIAPDGHYAGFITASSLTSYDTHGKKEMYLYNADADTIQCASCRPDGLPPTADVAGSQGGPFMADDGRIFFATKDALVPRDSNDGKFDVYEYADGRPQLISSGTASRDFTGGGSVINILNIPKTAFTGLESVSANGNDVYFTTFDSLVPQDHNGPFVKFYDARVNGGFEPEPEFAGCAAADECHGDGNPAPGAPNIGTGGDLGNTGNLQHSKQAKKAKKKAKRHHKRNGGGRNG